MPRTPLASGFICENNNQEYDRAIFKAVDALEEIRNKGSEIFTKLNAIEREGDYAFLVQMFYLRKMIEIIDSISVLTKAKVGSDSLLRTFFECVVYITHLYEKETYNRSLAYIYTLAVQKEFTNDRFNVTTASGKETLSALKKENKSTLLDEYVPYTEAANAGLQALRTKREFKDIEREYNRVKASLNQHPKQKGKRPEWYYLFDGSKCFKDLCFKLGFKGRYMIMYEMLSEATHAQDIIRYKVVGDEFHYDLFRNTQDYITTVNNVFLMSFEIFKSYSEELSQNEQDDYLKWAEWFGKIYKSVLLS